MSYKVDKSEFITFANTVGNHINSDDIQICFERVAIKLGDDYLDDRSNYFRNEIKFDEQLSDAFQRIASHCNEVKKECETCPVSKYCNTYIKERRENVKASSPKLVDLFCGAGGLSLGFTQEGFVTLLANDIEECCVDTYSHNHPETPRKNIVLGDISDMIENLSNYLHDEKVDIVIGGPPCQGFSSANRQRLIDDPRNKLYKLYIDVVNKIKPSFFVMENVKGMISVAGQVKEDFENIGYEVKYQVLNAKDFGVPQNRERLIFIGNCIGIDNDNIFNQIIDNSMLMRKFNLGDALFGLRKLDALTKKNSTEVGSLESGFKIEKNYNQVSNDYLNLINQGKLNPIVTNHKARFNNDRDIEIYKRLEPGDKSDDPKIADIMPYSSRSNIFRDKYYKLDLNKPCKTITAHMKFDCNMYIHPNQARGLTPREAARVQSYPDDYFFRGSYTKTYMQIGNSVPPLLGRAIARVIRGFISGGKWYEFIRSAGYVGGSYWRY